MSSAKDKIDALVAFVERILAPWVPKLPVASAPSSAATVPVPVTLEDDSPGTISVAWPVEDSLPVLGANTVRREVKILCLVQLDTGKFKWVDVLKLRVDMKKRALLQPVGAPIQFVPPIPAPVAPARPEKSETTRVP